MNSAERCDLLIVGAGPAGMAAALAAAPTGMAITIVDDNIHPGGQIWRDGPGVTLPPLARRVVKNGSNMRACSSGAMPWPSSLKVRQIWLPSSATAMMMWPDCSGLKAWVSAFISRLVSTCENAPGRLSIVSSGGQST